MNQFLEETIKYELKWMYSYPVEDAAFGVQTDKYQWCKRVLEGNATVEELLSYFEKYYGKDEEYFISKVRELLKEEF